MLCANCGTSLSETARFCEGCGVTVAPLQSSRTDAAMIGAAGARSLPHTSTTAEVSGDAWGTPSAGWPTAANNPGPQLSSHSEPSIRTGDSPGMWGAPDIGTPSANMNPWSSPTNVPSGQHSRQENTINTNVHSAVNVNVAAPNIMFAQRNNGPGLFVRIVWFFFIGSWLGPLTMLLAHALFLLVVTIPLSMALFNRIPQIMTLRPRNTTYGVSHANGLTTIEETTQEQLAWYIRVPYFVFFGLWASTVWFLLAEALGILTLGLALPLSFWMFNRVGAIATLYRT